MYIYIINVTHYVTGGGGFTSTMLITRSLVKAVLAARNAEDFGYDLVSDYNNGVFIYRVKQGRTYRKEEFYTHPYSTYHPMSVARFYREAGTKKEQWFNRELELFFRQQERKRAERRRL